EADGGVEGEMLTGGGEALRVERQIELQALQQIDGDEADEVEKQHRQRVGNPALLTLGIDAGNAVERAFRRQEFAPPEKSRHIETERPGCGDDGGENENDLQPACKGHGIT